jgi:hypothetical protein
MSLFLLENGSDHILLENGSGRLLLEDGAGAAATFLTYGPPLWRSARPRRGAVSTPRLFPAPVAAVLNTPLHRRPVLTSGIRRPGRIWRPVILPLATLYPVPTNRYPNPLAATSQIIAGGPDPNSATSDSGAQPDPFAASSRIRGQKY